MKNFEGKYDISDWGRIFSHITNRMLEGVIDTHGYRMYNLHPNRQETRRIWAARLVAENFLEDWDPELQVDHIDRNPLNNHYKNLRMVEATQNIWNRGMSCNNASGYTGVSFDNTRKRWMTRVMSDGKTKMKRFDTKEEAIEKAKEWYGEREQD